MTNSSRAGLDILDRIATVVKDIILSI
jgi:hypothetical protein